MPVPSAAASRAAKSQRPPRLPHVTAVQVTLALIVFVISVWVSASFTNPTLTVIGAILAPIAGAAVQVARQWEKAVVLRFGRFQHVAGPGLFLMIPIVDSVAAWIDTRVIATSFNAEETLTKDTVPVDVDAVLFCVVWDAEKAALEVSNYREAVSWASQTALRDIIGRTMLADMLMGRERLDVELQKTIDQRTAPWGITVTSVEIRDVVIPTALQDAMSRQAQAERERQARIILGQAELEIAKSFVDAGEAYLNNPVALHLRAMNMLYEGLKEKGALIVVPSTAVESMGLGTITGLTAMRKEQLPGVEGGVGSLNP